MKRQAKVLAVLFMMFVVFVGQSSAQEMGRYIVHTTGDSAVNEAARQGVEARAGLTLKELPTRTGLVVLIPDVAVGPIAGIPGVVAVEPDVVLTAVAEELPWGVDRIDADLAWGTVTGAGVTIAIIDTGIDKDHPDLAVADGINFVGTGPAWRRKVNPDAWDDDNGHGTHCAGIAAALDNDIGVVGVAPAASLYGVKVLDMSGSGYLSDVMDGIYWAADNGAAVINLSLGIDKKTLDQYPNDRDALEDAVDYADGFGVVVVAAAGNEGNGGDTVIYPARFASAIAVSATDSGDNLAGFSSTGPDVELAAPGVYIYSTYLDGDYATKSGTSMACPHVAGTAALMISNFVYSRGTLCSTAEDLGLSSDEQGCGLVDAAAAAAGVSGEPQPPVANAGPDQTVSDADGDGFETVTLDGSGSSDADGTIVSYEWKEGITVLGTAASITIDFAVSVHTVTLTVTDNDGLTDTDEVIITVTEAGSETAMHVVAIEMWYTSAGPNRFIYTKVTIVDSINDPVSGATVYLEITLPDTSKASGSGDTGDDGTVTFKLKSQQTGTYTSTVTDVVKSGWVYDNSANAETSETLEVQ